MYDFDVAISFAGEDRDVARSIAMQLKELGLRVFYDDDEQANLVGECLTEYLIEIYKNRAQYCVVLVSSNYVEKRWTRHEWKAAQARAFEEYREAYIIPVRLDDCELPGLLPTIGFLSLESKDLSSVVRTIFEKVAKAANINKVLREADSLFQRGKHRECCSRLESKSVSDVVGKYPAALKILANAKMQLDDYDEAKIALLRSIQIDENDFESHFLCGICCFRMNDFEEAIVHYERAEKICPSHVTVQIDLKAARMWAKVKKIPGLGNVITRAVASAYKKYNG